MPINHFSFSSRVSGALVAVHQSSAQAASADVLSHFLAMSPSVLMQPRDLNVFKLSRLMLQRSTQRKSMREK